VDKRIRDEFEHVIHEKKLYVWGGGAILGRHWNYLNKKYCVDGVVDRSLNSVYGKDVIRPEDFLVNYDTTRSVVLITCIYVTEIYTMLQRAGFKHIFTIFSIVNDDYFKFHPPFTNEEKMQLGVVAQWMEDDISKNVIAKLIQYRAQGEYDYRPIFEENQYFANGVWNGFSQEEVVVDAGAYDGDSVKEFIRHIASNLKEIYAFEPDLNNFKKLQKLASEDARIKPMPYAVWDQNGDISFCESGDANSRIEDGHGTRKIKTCALDNVLTDKTVTFIKMDVEGAELNALRGAKDIIVKHHPKLAICVYHKADDIWAISSYIKELVPEYKLYLNPLNSMTTNRLFFRTHGA